MRAIDICCGAGGWGCAARGLPIEIVLAIDLWGVACRTYSLNHPQTEVVVGDIRDPLTQAGILATPCDLVLGGIPCEWVSKYRSLVKVTDAELEKERATLDAALAIVGQLAPAFWCLEDVPEIVGQLPLMTPRVILDSRHWSAQRRKRAYIGHFPEPPRGGCRKTFGDVVRPGPYRIGPRAIDREPVTSQNFDGKHTLGCHRDRKGPTVLCLSSRRDAELVLVDPALPCGKRQIEWQEGAALQGFPTDYVFYGSPGDVAKQIGRAVQIDTGRAILEGIVEAWGSCRTVAESSEHSAPIAAMDP